MARYVKTLRSDMSAADAFAYMSDVENFAEWDPGVEKATQVEGTGPGEDAAYDLVVRGGLRPITMRYRVVEFEPPTRLLLVAETSLLRSVDEVVVEADGDGSAVTYDAELTLRGPLKVLDPILGRAFRGIGDRASEGLRRVLQESNRIAHPSIQASEA